MKVNLMMKCLTQALVVLSAIAMTYPVYANKVDISPTSNTTGKADVLVTQPVMINNQADNLLDQTERLKQITDSIEAVHNQPSLSLHPLGFFKNPSATIKQFFQENPHQTPQKVDPFGVAKVERLDSNAFGPINVTLTHF